jgi:hypothetical protein
MPRACCWLTASICILLTPESQQLKDISINKAKENGFYIDDIVTTRTKTPPPFTLLSLWETRAGSIPKPAMDAQTARGGV